MHKFEAAYAEVVLNILTNGVTERGRNGITKSIFGTQLKFDVDYKNFPLLQGRKIFYKGVIGEFAAFMNGAKTIKEFESFGCNYWKLWADIDGNIDVDYTKQLFENNQLQNLIEELQTNPKSRRHIISLWRPERLREVSLPCCHYAYQFQVDNDNKLNMIWVQRSVDTMIGLPSDMILASLWVLCLANQLHLQPGTVTMHLGNTHIYQEHIEGANKYLMNLNNLPDAKTMVNFVNSYNGIIGFKPNDIDISGYTSCEAIKFELKG